MKLYRRLTIVYLVLTALCVFLLILNLKGYSPNGARIDHGSIVIQSAAIVAAASFAIGAYWGYRTRKQKLREKR